MRKRGKGRKKKGREEGHLFDEVEREREREREKKKP